MTEGPIWSPSPERAAEANLARFSFRYLPGAGMAELYAWSIDRPEAFWRAVWEFCGVIGESGSGIGSPPSWPSSAERGKGRLAEGGGFSEGLGEGSFAEGLSPAETPPSWPSPAGRGKGRLVEGGGLNEGMEGAPLPDDVRRCEVLRGEPSADANPPAEGSLPPARGGGQEGGWFPGARLNFAENLLRYRDDRPALIAWDERGRQAEISYAELAREVARYQAALSAAGVVAGDRVGGYLPNVPETVIAALAAASLGAIWTSVSPDFGERAVLDRLGQTKPKVLLAATVVRYGGKRIDLSERLAAIAAELPETERIVLVGEPTEGSSEIPRAVPLAAWLASVDAPAEPTFVRLPFDHPLYVVYSSGTTGLPKGIVHGAGGTLLQHLKELILHTDLKRDDRIFYFTTCGWMMWNWLISSLAVGATVVLYDGAPFSPRKDILWEMAEAERITVFGTSAKYLALAEKEGIAPGTTRDLSSLRALLSTGSPLAPESYDYVYSRIKADVHLASISGGTDLLSCFALGDPTGPVYRGEIQCRGLGMAVEVWSSQSEPLDGERPNIEALEGEPGELVCTRPFPSMPVGFWNDPEGAKYRVAYFEHFSGRTVWRHGDWARLVPHGSEPAGLVIYGRSDATLNPGGVRIGTAEIYRQVERCPEVLESLAVGQEWQGDVRIVLFVRLRPGTALDEALESRIRAEIRRHASPHHVPKKIVAVADLPRTINGKLSELAVHAAIHGRTLGNADALANPEVLASFRDLLELAS